MLGFALVLCGFWRAHVRVVDGVVEAHGPALAWLLSCCALVPGGAAALTLGHVVIGRDRWSLESTRTHERVHVRQCEAWGPLFVPAYLSASLWAIMCGGDVYVDNRFEVEAFHAAQPEVTPPVSIRRVDSASVSSRRAHGDEDAPDSATRQIQLG
jgi:hypothetical protein